MNSVILQLAAKYLRGLLLVFAVLALFRGHNLPGGGFIGGLMAGLAIVYRGFAFDASHLEAAFKNMPWQFTGGGLLAIFLSFLPSVFLQQSLMTGVWMKIPLPFGGPLKL